MSPHRYLARLLPALVIVALALPVAGGAGVSGGGTTIASAPTMDSGQRVFGNLASDPVAQGRLGCGYDYFFHGWYQWWRLDLRAGDDVQISWETPGAPQEYGLCVFAAGTTDASVDQSRTVRFRTFNSSPVSGGASFTAAASGAYPLAIGGGFGDSGLYGRGPYSLFAEIRHKALVFLPRLVKVSLAGRVVADVRTPGGEPITDANLRLNLVGIWKDKPHLPPSSHVLSTATPVNGVAVLRFKLPPKLAGTTIRLRVAGGGPAYQPVTSVARKVRVGR